MKTAAIATIALMVGAAAGQDDVEAKKKRIGEIMKQIGELQVEAEKLLREISGGDPEKHVALMMEIAEKHAPEMAAAMKPERIAANERSASASLKALQTAELDFRANDRDENGVNDFWVGDVSGLYRYQVPGRPIKLIDLSIAEADAAPLQIKELEKHTTEKPKPKDGYLFVAIQTYEEKGKIKKYHMGDHRSYRFFGFAAYPAEYPKTGKHTFIIDEWAYGYAVRKDTGGKPPEFFPENPLAEGWR